MPAELLAGVELGGTKCVALIANGSKIVERITVPTTTPGDILNKLASWLGERSADLASFGIASFGPIRLAREAPDYGFILDTPKPGWQNVSVLVPFEALGLPTRIETDVNAAALAERAWGAGEGADSLVYITMGTGIGVGIVVNGVPVRPTASGGRARSADCIRRADTFGWALRSTASQVPARLTAIALKAC